MVLGPLYDCYNKELIEAPVLNMLPASGSRPTANGRNLSHCWGEKARTYSFGNQSLGV